jgi:hypothetical protein
MLFKEIIAVYSGIRNKPINQNPALLTVKAGGISGYHYASMGQFTK